MFEWERVPEGLADMPPGPKLARMVGSVDRSRLNGHDLVTLMQARSRQLAHDQAELYADMVELSHCPPGDAGSPPVREPEMPEFASDEIRAALSWTRRAADFQLDLAWQLKERLPQVWDSLHEGRIDLPKARTIAYGTAHVPDETARQVVEAVIEWAPGLTTGQLAARIRTLCVQADPEEAKERYELGIADRRVVVGANPDGTANLYGYQLPPDRTNALAERIDRLAKGLKRADDPRRLDQIRADVFLDLLEGNRHSKGHSSRGVVDIQVNLETLTGLADSPGEIPGWGPVIADIARQVAAEQHRSEWRVTITHPDTGQTLWNGTTRRRPTAAQRRHVETLQRTCIFPGCRMPAGACDLDHTHDWADGGPTNVRNLAPLCRHDHLLKHRGKWQLQAGGMGEYRWTSRLGHTYTTTGKPP